MALLFEVHTLDEQIILTTDSYTAACATADAACQDAGRRGWAFVVQRRAPRMEQPTILDDIDGDLAEMEWLAAAQRQYIREHVTCKGAGTQGHHIGPGHCKGNDECCGGDDGTAAPACAGWDAYCCRCGVSYALGQL